MENEIEITETAAAEIEDPARVRAVKKWAAGDAATAFFESIGGPAIIAAAPAITYPAHTDRERSYWEMVGPDLKDPAIRRLAARIYHDGGATAHETAYLIGTPPTRIRAAIAAGQKLIDAETAAATAVTAA